MSKTKKILWIRKLSCEHERWTAIAFIARIYIKPKVGEDCYCRDCHKYATIVDVREATKKELKELKQIIKRMK